MNSLITIMNGASNHPEQAVIALIILVLLFVCIAYAIRDILTFFLGTGKMIANQEQIIKLLKEQNEILSRKSE